ncbi:MAG: hypothetical protein C7B43_09770 [Sulfobacillus benefaciens]|uniref:Uncharacterized protein n=1 Tax=Sulfobacillus benefaciens TaxID=453960 RepID=A0A2T2X2G7_9FIRM|nr:MAG: hypothetical protein C7B43_09770 [Sulfobacillus benefaciens]
MKRKKWPQRTRKAWQQGQVLPLVALFLPLLIGMAGLALTVGTVYFGQAKLQNAVDAAALAGAQEMNTSDPNAPGDQATLVTQDDASATHVVVQTQTAPPNTVLAQAQAQVPGTFATLFGIKTFTVKARAVASYGAGQPFNYAVFQGDPRASDPKLLLNGSTDVTSSSGSGANVHSNNKVYLNGNTTVEGSCGGNPSATLNGNGSCRQGLIQNASEIAMPQWTIPQATPSGATIIGSSSNPKGLTVNGNNTVSGNYVIYGTLIINGNSTVTGHYLVEDGSVIINGNATVQGSITVFGGGIYCGGNITQSGGGTLALAAFTANRQTASDATAAQPANPPTPGSIVMNGNVTVNSILYAPDSYIDLNGNVTVNGAVVGYQDCLNGNVTVAYNAAETTAVPVRQVALIQ